MADLFSDFLKIAFTAIHRNTVHVKQIRYPENILIIDGSCVAQWWQ